MIAVAGTVTGTVMTVSPKRWYGPALIAHPAREAHSA